MKKKIKQIEDCIKNTNKIQKGKQIYILSYHYIQEIYTNNIKRY